MLPLTYSPTYAVVRRFDGGRHQHPYMLSMTATIASHASFSASSARASLTALRANVSGSAVCAAMARVFAEADETLFSAAMNVRRSAFLRASTLRESSRAFATFSLPAPLSPHRDRCCHFLANIVGRYVITRRDEKRRAAGSHGPDPRRQRTARGARSLWSGYCLANVNRPPIRSPKHESVPVYVPTSRWPPRPWS